MSKVFQDIASQGRTLKYPFPALARLSKLFEEGGEFAETVMHNQGYLPHKVPKETPFGEAADVIICVVDTLSACYPDLSPEWIAESLANHIRSKREKWKQVVIDPQNQEYENNNCRQP